MTTETERKLVIRNETEAKWKIDRARHYSEQLIEGLVAGVNVSLKIGDDEDTVMIALMAIIEARVLGPDREQGVAAIMGTLATAVLQLARVERGMSRVTPSPEVD